MTKPRSQLVDSEQPRYYHVTSRCVRRAWLLGKDPLTGIDYDHRKEILLNRMKHLAQFFSVEIMGYAIMSNHFHIVLHYDPTEKDSWSDEEVAERWCRAFHGKSISETHDDLTTRDDLDLSQSIRYHTLLLDPERLARARNALGSLSRFMQHLKQPFSVWANHEDGCKGHFFENRFYSGVLLTDEDLLACMAYVDLNPVEAGIAQSLRDAADTSVYERLNVIRFDSDQLDAYLRPLWTGTDLETHTETGPETDIETAPQIEKAAPTNVRGAKPLSCTLRQYAEQLNLAIAYFTHPLAEIPSGLTSWMARLVNRERAQRGSASVFFDYS